MIKETLEAKIREVVGSDVKIAYTGGNTLVTDSDDTCGHGPITSFTKTVQLSKVLGVTLQDITWQLKCEDIYSSTRHRLVPSYSGLLVLNIVPDEVKPWVV